MKQLLEPITVLSSVPAPNSARPRKYTEDELEAMPLWQLLKVSIEDAIVAFRDPSVSFNMGVWMDPNVCNGDVTVCQVCLGGAVLLRNVGIEDFDADGSAGPRPFMMALDNLRLGDVPAAMKLNNVSYSVGDFEVGREIYGRYYLHLNDANRRDLNDADNFSAFIAALTDLSEELRQYAL